MIDYIEKFYLLLLKYSISIHMKPFAQYKFSNYIYYLAIKEIYHHYTKNTLSYFENYMSKRVNLSIHKATDYFHFLETQNNTRVPHFSLSYSLYNHTVH